MRIDGVSCTRRDDSIRLGESPKRFHWAELHFGLQDAWLWSVLTLTIAGDLHLFLCYEGHEASARSQADAAPRPVPRVGSDAPSVTLVSERVDAFFARD